MMTKPDLLGLNLEGIPAELRALDAWIVWRLEVRGGVWTKIPICPASGLVASTSDQTTWSSFADAERAMSFWGADGLGLCRTKDYLFLDLDGVLYVQPGADPSTGNLIPYTWASRILGATIS